MSVVDTNIIAHFWLPSDHAELCEELFQWEPEWVAPVLWKSEFRNVVILYLGKNLIDLPEAIQITEKAENQMKEREFHVNSVQIYNLKQLTRNIPSTADIDDKEAKMSLASKLYERGKLTLGQVAELAGYSK